MVIFRSLADHMSVADGLFPAGADVHIRRKTLEALDESEPLVRDARGRSIFALGGHLVYPPRARCSARCPNQKPTIAPKTA